MLEFRAEEEHLSGGEDAVLTRQMAHRADAGGGVRDLALARRHWPLAIMVVLLASAALSYALVGFGAGRSRRTFSTLDSIYGVVLAVAMWMVIDLDYARHGVLQVPSTPMVESTEAFGSFVQGERERWEKMADELGIERRSRFVKYQYLWVA